MKFTYEMRSKAGKTAAANLKNLIKAKGGLLEDELQIVRLPGKRTIWDRKETISVAKRFVGILKDNNYTEYPKKYHKTTNTILTSFLRRAQKDILMPERRIGSGLSYFMSRDFGKAVMAEFNGIEPSVAKNIEPPIKPNIELKKKEDIKPVVNSQLDSQIVKLFGTLLSEYFVPIEYLKRIESLENRPTGINDDSSLVEKIAKLEKSNNELKEFIDLAITENESTNQKLNDLKDRFDKLNKKPDEPKEDKREMINVGIIGFENSKFSHLRRAVDSENLAINLLFYDKDSKPKRLAGDWMIVTRGTPNDFMEHIKKDFPDRWKFVDGGISKVFETIKEITLISKVNN